MNPEQEKTKKLFSNFDGFAEYILYVNLAFYLPKQEAVQKILELHPLKESDYMAWCTTSYELLERLRGENQ